MKDQYTRFVPLDNVNYSPSFAQCIGFSGSLGKSVFFFIKYMMLANGLPDNNPNYRMKLTQSGDYQIDGGFMVTRTGLLQFLESFPIGMMDIKNDIIAWLNNNKEFESFFIDHREVFNNESFFIEVDENA